jgi:hypothetical protein
MHELCIYIEFVQVGQMSLLTSAAPLFTESVRFKSVLGSHVVDMQIFTVG